MRRNDTDFGKAGIHRGTLLEVTVVMAIVIAAVSIPNLMSMAGNVRKRGNKRDLKGKSVLAKMRAALNFARAGVHGKLSRIPFLGLLPERDDYSQ